MTVSSPIAVATEGIFTQVTAGLESGYGLRADGALFAWGDNTYGQLGDDTYEQRDAPVSVVGGHRYNYIAAGWHHILGIKADGSAWAWGDDSKGQTGIGEEIIGLFNPDQWENVGTQALFLDYQDYGYNALNITVPPTSNGATYIPPLGHDGRGTHLGAGVDFDISVNFEAIQHPSTSFWIIYVGVEEYNTEVEFNMQRLYSSGNDGYRGVYIRQNGGVVNFGPMTVRDDISGRMRLTRVGSLWTMYAWYNNTWNTIQTMTSLESAQAVQVRLEMRTGDNFPSAECNFTNFSETAETTITYALPVSGDHEFVKVDAGECHSIGLKEDGTAWTWGCNEGGQLGYQTFTGAIGTWAHGGGMAIDQNSVLWGWGVNNPSGQLGDGTITNRSSPVSVLNTGGAPWMSVTLGPYAGMRQTGDWLDDPCLIPGNCKGIGQTGSNENWGIKDEGNGETSLWMWGDGVAGNHGHGTWNTDYSSPVSVLGSRDRGFWIAGSANRSCALDKFGEFWAWGDTAQYPLQFLTPNSFNSPVNVTAAMFEDCPKPCTHPFTATGNKVMSLGNGGLNGLLISFGGQGFAWGTNGTAAGHMCQGAAGAGTQWGSPNPITQGAGYPFLWRHAAMGEDNSVWMDEDGNVWMCGYNPIRAAMVGLKFGGGGPTGRSTPTIIEGSPHNGIKVAAAWTSQTFGFLRADGSLWMWGENNQGECGVGTTSDVTSPTSVLGSGQSYRFVDFIMGGESGTVALDDTGQVWGWGQWGHIGNNTTTDRSIPTMTSLPLITPEAFRSSPTQIGFEDTGPFFTDIAAGNQHNVALKEDGSAWAWGSNTSGQLGDGTTTNTAEPKSVKGGVDLAWTITPEEDGLIEVIDIAAGTDYSMALGNPMTSNCPIFFDPLIADINNELNPTHWTEVPKIDSTITVGRRHTAKPALKLEDASSIAGNQYVLSNFTLDGEFIIETEWAWAANGGVIWVGSLFLQSNDPNDSAFAYIGKGNFPASSYRFRYFADGGADGNKDVVSGVDEGKLRLTRTIAPTGTGMDLKAEHYYPATDTWTQIGIKQPWYPGVVDVRLDMFKSAVATTTEFWFANFCIKEGTFSGDTGNLLWSWGDDQCGKLGDDLTTNKSLPIVAFTIRK